MGDRARPRNATVPVLVPVPLDAPFDYALAGGLAAGAGRPRRGAVRAAPGGGRGLGRARRQGRRRRRAAEAGRRRLDAPPLPAAAARADRPRRGDHAAPLGAALKLVLSVPAALEPPAPKLGLVAAAGAGKSGLTAARRRVLAALADGLPRGAGRARARGRRRRGRRPGDGQGRASDARRRCRKPTSRRCARPARCRCRRPRPRPRARSARRSARGQASRCSRACPAPARPRSISRRSRRRSQPGRQALILLPEIALTSQLLERFGRRFGRPPALWHSELGAAARRRTWRRIAEGREQIVIGARSAVFLPLPALGLIVVDEEHDASFKQEDGVPYHGREVAIARARLEGCPAVLVSATPALETACRMGRIAGAAARTGCGYALLLPARHGGARDARRSALIDLRRDRPPRGGWLAPGLRRALEATLGAGEQALLFLNRRGFAPLTLCRACGHRLRCPNCSAWLVTIACASRLVCHHCGYGRAEPDHCPSCGTVDALVACGPGVERLAEEVRGAAARGARRDPDQRQPGRAERGGGAAARHARPRARPPDRHPDHRQGPPFPGPYAGRRGRRRPRPRRAAICAPPSASSSCSTRSRAAPVGRSGRAAC